jgi:tetratricopeptide (TPR) repeat protein
MASPPDAHDNASHGAVYGQLVQAGDIHGGVTINAPAQAAPTAPVADVSLDPPRLATAVRGRDALLAELGAAMKAGAPVPHVLTGPGGFGKTTVAAALAERARADGWTVFWVRPGSVAASMLEAAVELGGSRAEAEQVRPTRHQAARWAWRHLDNASRPWLLVIDNADRPEELDPENRPGDQLGWMRSSPGGFVLVTSRVDDPAQWAPARVHRIGELDGAAAATALTDHAGTAELAGADELAERLGGVPLALFLAGRILATHRVLFPDARALLGRLDEDLSALDRLAAPLVGGHDGDRRLLSGVWGLSLRLAAEKDPHAAPLLRLLAILGADAVDIPLRRLPVSELGLGPLDEVSFARTVNALIVHGLITLTTSRDEQCLRLHPLVSETVRDTFTDNDAVLLDDAEHLLAKQRDRDMILELHAHLTLHRLSERLRPDQPRAGLRARLNAARCLLLLGMNDTAEDALTTLLATARGTLGEQDADTLQVRHFLAESWLYQGRLDEAEDEYRALLRERETVLGLEHPSALDTRHQLILVATRRGDWDTAVVMARALLADRVRVSGPEDLQTLLTRENLAWAVYWQGDSATAERELRDVRQAYARTQGEYDENTNQADMYLAFIAADRGDHACVRETCDRLLRRWESKGGRDHPDVQMVLDLLARLPSDTTTG